MLDITHFLGKKAEEYTSMRNRAGFIEAEVNILGSLMASGPAPLFDLIQITSMNPRSILYWVLDFESQGYLNNIEDSWEGDVKDQVFDLTLKGLIKILQRQILREKISDSFEKISDIHSEKCPVFKYFQFFKEKEVDDLIMARLMNDFYHRHRYSDTDFWWITVPRTNDSATTATSKLLGFPLLLYDRYKVEEELKQDFTAQLKIFE